MPNIGQTAPDFTLNDQQGNPVKLSDLLSGGDLILYFYPADFSPGCTVEACTFRDNYNDIQDAGARIVWISSQGVASHARFSKRFNIPFPLLSDPSKQVVKAYGVNGLMGLGVRRGTFLMNAKGIVQNRVITDISINSHTKLIKETVRRGKVETIYI